MLSRCAAGYIKDVARPAISTRPAALRKGTLGMRIFHTSDKLSSCISYDGDGAMRKG